MKSGFLDVLTPEINTQMPTAGALPMVLLLRAIVAADMTSWLHDKLRLNHYRAMQWVDINALLLNVHRLLGRVVNLRRLIVQLGPDLRGLMLYLALADWLRLKGLDKNRWVINRLVIDRNGLVLWKA